MYRRIAVLLGTVLLASAGCGSSSPGVTDSGTDAGTGKGGASGKGGAGGSAGSGTGGAAAGRDGGSTTDGSAATGGSAATDGGKDGPVGPFSVGGTLSGLAGSGLILADGAGHQLTITANGVFTFPNKLAAGSAVAVTATQQPTSPSQVCTVTGGTIASLSQNVTAIVVACVTTTYTVGGTLAGLTGSGLVLQDNGGDNLALTANGAFTFATKVGSGSTFTVTVKTQPTAPAQTCQVSGGSGTIGGANVTSVSINCGTNTYAIGGTVSGLTGTGLVLQDNLGDDLSVTGNGSFAFATPILSGGAFSVTVKTQPTAPVQSCSVSLGSGTVAVSNVTTVAVTCSTTTYPVGGNVVGLVGSGLTLQDNLGNNLSITANGPFVFTSPVASGTMYSVTVLTQPSTPSQTCTVTAGSGTVGSSAITDVAIGCTTNSFAVGGTVIGLSGSGLVLQDNGGDDLPITADGAFAFPTSLTSGGSFVVTIATQPSNPQQTCSISGSTGTVGGAAVSSVTVNCSTSQHAVSGAVTNLSGAGLALSLNGGSSLAISSSGGFSFPTTLPSGSAYTVTVVGQPTGPSQTCSVTAGTGTITTADITNVAVDCTINSYVIGGSVSGLAGVGLTLQDNGGDDLGIVTNGTFVFATSVPSGQGYNVVVSAQPSNPSQSCVVTGGAGGVTAADISNVSIICTTNLFQVGGTVTGLTSTATLQNNGGDALTLNSNGTFTFATSVASNATYAVTVSAQPASPSQTCTVTSGTGTVTSGPVTNVTVTCVTNTYAIGGVLSGVTGTGLTLQDNGGDDLLVNANGTFTFVTPVASGSGYLVTIKTQPTNPTQTCSLGGVSGTVGNSAVTSVSVNCATNSYIVGGTITGLTGGGLVIQNNGAGDLAISGSGTFAFAAPILSGQPYAVTVKTQPTNPWQTCVVTGGSGTITNSNISAQIACTANPYSVSVNVTNLGGSGLVLQDNAGDNLAIGANGLSTFATQVRSGLTYAVTVLSQPTSPWQTCTVTAPAGSIAGAGVTLAVNCVANTYTIGGTVSGLSGSGLILKDNGGDNRSIAANGTFTFATPVASGTTYTVTVGTAPTTPAQNCTITNGTGTVTSGPVSNVTVVCTNVVICATAAENGTISLACPAGQKVFAIDFASYGTPNGACGAFTTDPTCNAAASVTDVSTPCFGNVSCSVAATNGVFGDPCVGTVKRLYVQARCQ
jgi:large repetitive protein